MGTEGGRSIKERLIKGRKILNQLPQQWFEATNLTKEQQ